MDMTQHPKHLLLFLVVFYCISKSASVYAYSTMSIHLFRVYVHSIHQIQLFAFVASSNKSSL